MSQNESLRPSPRPDETPCDYLLRCFEGVLREMYISTVGDGKERSMTVFSTPGSRWGRTRIRVGNSDYVATQPVPDNAREHIEIHTHPPSNAATLSTADYETFGYHIIRAAPYSDTGGVRGYAVIGADAPEATSTPSTAVLRTLTPNSKGRQLSPVERRDIVRELAQAQSPETSKQILRPFSMECVSTFHVPVNATPENRSFGRIQGVLGDLARDAGLLSESESGKSDKQSIREDIEAKIEGRN